MIRILFDKVTQHVAVRFFLSGGTSAFVDLLLLFLLNTILGMHYLTSAVFAFIGAFGVSFMLHKHWTFKSHSQSAHKQVVMYLGTSLVGLGLNTLLMYVFVSHLHVMVLLSQVIVGLTVAFFSFFLSRNLVFKVSVSNDSNI